MIYFLNRDICLPSWELKMGNLIVTDSDDKHPCCLPGLEADPNVPHGPCRLSSPCFCESSICYPPLPLDDNSAVGEIETIKDTAPHSGADLAVILSIVTMGLMLGANCIILFVGRKKGYFMQKQE